MSKKLFVLDACALLAFIKLEPGYDRVKKIIRGPNNLIYMHMLNSFETAYQLLRLGFGEEEAWAAARPIGITLVEDCEPSPMLYHAARMKARTNNLSLADCFALALAEKLGAHLVTSDTGFREATPEKEIVYFR